MITETALPSDVGARLPQHRMTVLSPAQFLAELRSAYVFSQSLRERFSRKNDTFVPTEPSPKTV